MASGVRVDISSPAVVAALDVPGGGVYEWRDRIATRAVVNGRAAAPVNDPANAQHRGGIVGTYHDSFGWDRLGSIGHLVRARIFNTADHAVIVEEGRRASFERQTFSWTRWGGEIRTVNATRPRAGRHTLLRAVEAAIAGTSS